MAYKTLYHIEDPAVLGAFKVMVEGHEQFDILLDDQLDHLDQYRVLVLPDSIRVTAEVAERIRCWVCAGGKLLATGNAGLTATDAGFLLGDVYGVRYHEHGVYRFGYMDLGADLQTGLATLPQLVDGVFVKVMPVTAEIMAMTRWPAGESVGPYRSYRHELPPPGALSDYPAIVRNAYGQGEAIYIANPIFSVYWNNNHYWLKKIVYNCLSLLSTDRPFEVEASPNVEVNLMQKNDRLYLHLINFQGSQCASRSAYYEPVEHITPVYRLRVRLRTHPPKCVICQPSGEELAWQMEEEWLTFVVPEVHIHTIVEICSIEQDT